MKCYFMRERKTFAMLGACLSQTRVYTYNIASEEEKKVSHYRKGKLFSL